MDALCGEITLLIPKQCFLGIVFDALNDHLFFNRCSKSSIFKNVFANLAFRNKLIHTLNTFNPIICYISCITVAYSIKTTGVW